MERLVMIKVPLLMVGEQPGDQEDRERHPVAGPYPRSGFSRRTRRCSLVNLLAPNARTLLRARPWYGHL